MSPLGHEETQTETNRVSATSQVQGHAEQSSTPMREAAPTVRSNNQNTSKKNRSEANPATKKARKEKVPITVPGRADQQSQGRGELNTAGVTVGHGEETQTETHGVGARSQAEGHGAQPASPNKCEVCGHEYPTPEKLRRMAETNLPVPIPRPKFDEEKENPGKMAECLLKDVLLHEGWSSVDMGSIFEFICAHCLVSVNSKHKVTITGAGSAATAGDGGMDIALWRDDIGDLIVVDCKVRVIHDFQ